MENHNNNYAQGISSTTVFLERFFENLLFQGKNELKNRFCHILWKDDGKRQSAISKCQNVTLEESSVLKIIAADPGITQKKIAHSINKSDRTVKRITSSLQKRGLLVRKNGKRNVFWEVLQ